MNPLIGFKIKFILSIVLSILVLSGCDNNQSIVKKVEIADKSVSVKNTDQPSPIKKNIKVVSKTLKKMPTISARRLIEHVKILASDEFEGRAPATEGEKKTINYIAEQFKLLGLEPGNGDSYFQQVPVVSISAKPDAVLHLSSKLQQLKLNYGTQMIVSSPRTDEVVDLKDSPLVFVGYGIVAPEYHWNDYAGIDMKGKTAVILVNDPGFVSKDKNLFNGYAMTYYGRWTYKYDEAARQGADGAIIIHQTDAAGYPWDVVNNSWTGPQFSLVRDNQQHQLKIESWLTGDSADQLFKMMGRDRKSIELSASQPGFKAFEMDVKASVKINNRIEKSMTHNVVAKIIGKNYPDETILYTAHWDHLGRDHNLKGDQIYNGALDNATGTAALIEIAHAFKQMSIQEDRTVMFLSLTSEEQGLLGSEYYAENPLQALEKTVAEFNIDGVNNIGPTKDVVVIGAGNSQLEDMLADKVKQQNRVIKSEPTPEKGYYFRSDHFNLAKKGVPSLYLKAGEDNIEKGLQYGVEKAKEYIVKRYHKPTDEYDENWNMEGGALDMDLLFQIGLDLSQSRQWPEWYKGNAFRSERLKSADSRR